MPRIEGGVNLKYGTLTKIAKRRKLTVGHVSLVARGEREGSKGLVAAILRERDRQLAQEAVGGSTEAPAAQEAA